jgi:hypothetical protein
MKEESQHPPLQLVSKKDESKEILKRRNLYPFDNFSGIPIEAYSYREADIFSVRYQWYSTPSERTVMIVNHNNDGSKGAVIDYQLKTPSIRNNVYLSAARISYGFDLTPTEIVLRPPMVNTKSLAIQPRIVIIGSTFRELETEGNHLLKIPMSRLLGLENQSIDFEDLTLSFDEYLADADDQRYLLTLVVDNRVFDLSYLHNIRKWHYELMRLHTVEYGDVRQSTMGLIMHRLEDVQS